MNELIIQGKKYISSKHAAELTGYAKDYIGQLCREGYVEATMVGRSWYVLETSIMAHRFGKDGGDNGKATVATSAAPLETTQEIVESAKDKPADTWVPAIYVSEPHPPLIPPVAEHVTAPRWTVQQDTQENSAIPSMQEAWQEWFSMNSRQKLLETEEVIEERDENEKQEESVDRIREPYERENEPMQAVPIALTPIAPVVDAAPAVPIVDLPRRSFEIQHPMRNSIDLPEQITIHALSQQREDAMNVPRMSNNQRVRSSKVAAARSGSLVITALLGAVTVVICAAAFVGSGLGDKYIRASVFHSNPIVSFLEGKTFVKR